MEFHKVTTGTMRQVSVTTKEDIVTENTQEAAIIIVVAVLSKTDITMNTLHNFNIHQVISFTLISWL